MNRIINHFPRKGFSLPVSNSYLSRPNADRLLRDVAYVLHLTRSLKESILTRQKEGVL